MKVNIQKWLKRGIPLLSVIVALVVILSVPVSASMNELNYRDYITSNVTVDGNKNRVTIRIPEEYCQIAMFDSNWKLVSSTSGYHFSYDYTDKPVTDYYITIDPFVGSFLSLVNIPSDAKWNLNFTASFESWTNDLNPASTTLYQAYWKNDSMDNRLSYDLNPTLIDEPLYFYDSSGSFLSGYDGVSFYFSMRISDDNDFDQIDIYAVSFNIQLTINSYYLALQEMGYTEQIDELKQQLADQGKKLDDIINGSPEDQEKADQFEQQASGAIGDLQEAGSAMDQLEKPNISAADLVPSDVLGGVAFLSYAGVISEFWNNKTLTTLVTILGGFLILSYVLYGGKDS